MDCKDLMIGDWANIKGKSVKVTLDDLRTMLILFEDVDFHIEPIPLTEDILVKNGFEKGKTISGTELFCCEVTHQLAGDGFEIQRITIYPNWVVYAETATGIVRLGINYVHTLQHLLCLCGIEKELTI